jgi:NitT/TauT family transport system substrate-binding protein
MGHYASEMESFTDRMHVLFRRDQRNRGIRKVCLLFLAASVARCWSEQARELRLGHFPNLTHAQALYARATGKFEKALGIPIKWVSFNAGPSAIEALFSDSVDVTFIGPNPAINGYLKSRGNKFVIIAGAASGGAGLVLRKNSGIKSDKDFFDKIIATPQTGNTQDVAARTWFAAKGYKLREKGGRVSLVALSNPDQLTMFRKKQIDGAWTIEPWVSRLEIEGNGILFLDEKSLWPHGRYATTEIVCTRRFLQTQTEVIKKLLDAHIEVSREIQNDPVGASKVLNEELKRETGKVLKDEVITNAMSRIEFTWDPIISSVLKYAEAAHEIGFLRKRPDLQGLFDLKILNEVLTEKKLPVFKDSVTLEGPLKKAVH